MSEFADVRIVIEEYFETEITAGESVVTGWDNSDVDQPENAVWCRCTVMEVEDTQVSIGHPTKRFRKWGALGAEVYGPVDKGTKDINALCSTIAQKFRSAQLGSGTESDPYVFFRAPTTKVVGRSGNYYQIDVICPFYADLTRTVVT